MTRYDPQANGKGCYLDWCNHKRAEMLQGRCPAAKRVIVIGNCELYEGDCLEVMESLESVNHTICDPPYESSLHNIKDSLHGRVRVDNGPDIHGLNFYPIDATRDVVISRVKDVTLGWFIAFCTIEGVSKWADAINASPIKYKRACIWVKPDSMPQLNGQGPAQGAECFVSAWCGTGHAKWNSGGKRGVYTHCVNGQDRHGSHPTEKPWRLFAELLCDFTKRGEAVLDPFMGSGTTGVACVKLGRKFIGIELDPDYFDIACERIAKAQQQPDLFIEAEKPKAEQLDLMADPK